jgi:hypothetical protein
MKLPFLILFIGLISCRPTYNPNRNYKLSQYYEHKAEILQCKMECLRTTQPIGWAVDFNQKLDSVWKFQALSNYYNPWIDPRPSKPIKQKSICKCE